MIRDALSREFVQIIKRPISDDSDKELAAFCRKHKRKIGRLLLDEFLLDGFEKLRIELGLPKDTPPND